MANPDDADMTQPQFPTPSPYPSPSLPPAAFDPPPAPPSPPARTVARHQRQSRRRSLAAIGLAGLLSCAAIFGYTLGTNHASNSTGASSASVLPRPQSPLPDIS